MKRSRTVRKRWVPKRRMRSGGPLLDLLHVSPAPAATGSTELTEAGRRRVELPEQRIVEQAPAARLRRPDASAGHVLTARGDVDEVLVLRLQVAVRRIVGYSADP